MSRSTYRQFNSKPYLTYIFLGICVLVYVYMLLTHGTTMSIPALIATGANVAPLMVFENEWWRLITAAFIHIGFRHLFFNGISIYFIGSELEAVIGHVRFFLVYFVSAVGGNLFSFAFNSGSVSAGASTSIFGLFACYLALAYLNPNSMVLGARASSFTVLLVINFVNGFLSQGVDNWGHFGGVVFGALVTIIIGKSTRTDLSKGFRITALIALFAIAFVLVYIGTMNVNRLI